MWRAEELRKGPDRKRLSDLMLLLFFNFFTYCTNGKTVEFECTAI